MLITPQEGFVAFITGSALFMQLSLVQKIYLHLIHNDHQITLNGQGNNSFFAVI